MEAIYAKARSLFDKEETLEKPKRSSPIAIPNTPDCLDVSIKQVGGGRLQGTFLYDENAPKKSVAYDIAGNAVECSDEDILQKKLSPTPYRQVEKEMIWTDEHLKKTRSGLTYGA